MEKSVADAMSVSKCRGTREHVADRTYGGGKLNVGKPARPPALLRHQPGLLYLTILPTEGHVP